MFDIGVPELVLILVILLLLFGGKKIPELTRSIGESIRQFKNGMNGDEKTKDKPASSGTKK